MRGRVLIVAGSDSGGGAGIQADIKTISMLDAFAATAITALTAQNTEGVFGIFPIPPEFIRQQIAVVLDDIGADAIKTGMLHDAAVIEAVVAVLQERAAGIPAVVDPVMVAKGGARLIEPDAIEALKRLQAILIASTDVEKSAAGRRQQPFVAVGAVEIASQLIECQWNHRGSMSAIDHGHAAALAGKRAHGTR